MNMGKTKYTVTCGTGDDLHTEYEKIQHVKNRWKEDEDIIIIVAKQLHSTLCNKTINKKTKKRIYKTTFKSCVT